MEFIQRFLMEGAKAVVAFVAAFLVAFLLKYGVHVDEAEISTVLLGLLGSLITAVFVWLKKNRDRETSVQ
jgi:hypothetical protein